MTSEDAVCIGPGSARLYAGQGEAKATNGGEDGSVVLGSHEVDTGSYDGAVDLVSSPVDLSSYRGSEDDEVGARANDGRDWTKEG